MTPENQHFRRHSGLHFWSKINPKTHFCLRGSRSLSGAILGGFLAVFGTLSGGLECYPGTTLQQFWHIFKNEIEPSLCRVADFQVVALVY